MFSQLFHVAFLSAAAGSAPDFQPTTYLVDNDTSVAAADFNGDGRPDIAITNNGSVNVLVGDGQGSFQLSIVTPLPAGFSVRFGQTGDFNGDGVVDLVVFYQDAANAATGDAILYGNGDGSFQSPRFLASLDYEWSGVNSLAVGDINGDGLSDVCHVIVYWSSSWGDDGQVGSSWSSYVVALLNLGDGTFQGIPVLYNDGYSWERVQLSDMNGDGYSDIVAGRDRAIKIALSRGDGSFNVTSELFPPQGWFSSSNCAIGRFNGDSTLDIAARFANLYPDHLKTYLGNGDGTFLAGATSPGAQKLTELVADVNGDGKLDVFSSDSVGVGAYFGDGSGSFAYRRVFSHEDTLSTPGLATGDFNGDGWPDLVLAKSPDAVVVLLNDGAWAAPPMTPMVSVGNVSKLEGNKGNTSFTFEVRLSTASTQTVTVSFRTTGGTAAAWDGDYRAANGTLTFSPGQTSKTITIAVRGDRNRESDEVFYVDLFGASSNAGLGQSRGTGTILNDD